VICKGRLPFERMPEDLGRERFTTHIHSARLLAAHVHFALHEDADAFRIVSEERRIAYEIRNFFNVWLSFLTEAYFHLERNDDAAAVAP